MQEKIKNLIKEALKNLDIEAEDIFLEHPEDFKNGDYSTNVAMVYAKEIGKNPKELAEKIIAEVNKNLPKEIEKVEVAGAGFINFSLSREFFVKKTEEILKQKENFGKNNLGSNKKIMVEYTDPNPFKEFHIGHLMSNTIGEAISRIIGAGGAEVKRACYQGDVGLHVAKTIWQLKKDGEEIVKDISQTALAYATGSKLYETSPEIKKEIEEINKKIYNRSDEMINKLYDSGKKISLDYFETIYEVLGTKFDFYFFESESGTFGKEIVEKNIDKIFEKSDGAIIFRGENFKENLHTRVFINKENLPTYEAKELGLAKIKFDKYAYDESIVITGNEINEYFKVLLEAMKQVFPELAQKTKHISHGMLRLPSGKMSSRTGDVVTAESLLDLISEKVIEKIKETNRVNLDDRFVNQIAVAALKYSILKQAIGGDIIFDFEKSISFEGNSGPYLQYSYARAKSILVKAKEEKIVSAEHGHNSLEKFLVLAPSRSQVSVETTFSSLERLLYRFPEIVLHSAKEFEPHHIATYLTELARAFNAFYGNSKIVDKDDTTSPYKVALTEAFSIVIKNGLYLLGIEAPEKM